MIFRILEVYEQVIVSEKSLPTNQSETHRITQKDAKTKDIKTLFVIHNCFDVNVFEKIDEFVNSKSPCDILIKIYKDDANVNKFKI